MAELAAKLSPETRKFFAKEILPDLTEKKIPQPYADLYTLDFETVPVNIRTFVTDPYFLGGALEGTIFEAVIEDLIEIFDGEYDEILCAGGIGWGKTREVIIGTIYEVYVLSCLRDPAKNFGLIPGSPLVFMNVSITKSQATRVLFAGMYDMIKRCKYFKEKFPFQENIRTEIRFPKGITCYPVASYEGATLGEGVFSAMIDEANFMQIVQKSRKTRDAGDYDQVVALYETLKKRIRSRTNQRGRLPGHIWLISSARYPEDFTERLEIQALSDPRILVRRHASWETRPRSNYMAEEFKVEVGDRGKRSRVLTGTETDVRPENVYSIPKDFYPDFIQNPDKAVRDILGRPTLAVRPFFTDRSKIQKMFQLGEDAGMQFPFTKFTVTLTKDDEKLIPQHFHMVKVPVLDDRDRQLRDDKGKPLFSNRIHQGPYFSHNDGSKRIDSWGFCVAHVVGTKRCPRTAGDPVMELRPIIRLDLILEIVAPPQGSIGPQHVRGLYYQMAALGMNFKKISYDTFASQESIEILKEEGYDADNFSVDTSPEAYETFRIALEDERIQSVYIPKFEKELLYVEWDEKKGKVDHPAVGSKDLADAAVSAAHHAERAWRAGLPSFEEAPPVMTESSIIEREPEDADVDIWEKMRRGETLTDEEWGRLG